MQTISATREAEPATAYQARWEEFGRGLPAAEPQALKALRREAIERFTALGFPTLRQEEWRFTNVAPIARASFVLA
nr:Fe-S cluster assembly protein SufD [Acidobacteriota bacterium]